MRHFLAIGTVIFAQALAPVAQAEESGSSLMERGAKLFLEGILKEAEPALEDLQGLMEGMEPALQDFVQQMGPALAELMEEIEDFSAYHPPEVLPNGDIILRKKQADPLPEPPEDESAVDL